MPIGDPGSFITTQIKSQSSAMTRESFKGAVEGGLTGGLLGLRGGLPGVAGGAIVGAALGKILGPAKQVAKFFQDLAESTIQLSNTFKNFSPILNQVSMEWEITNRKITAEWAKTVESLVKVQSGFAMESRRWEAGEQQRRYKYLEPTMQKQVEGWKRQEMMFRPLQEALNTLSMWSEKLWMQFKQLFSGKLAEWLGIKLPESAPPSIFVPRNLPSLIDRKYQTAPMIQPSFEAWSKQQMQFTSRLAKMTPSLPSGLTEKETIIRTKAREEAIDADRRAMEAQSIGDYTAAESARAAASRARAIAEGEATTDSGISAAGTGITGFFERILIGIQGIKDAIMQQGSISGGGEIQDPSSPTLPDIETGFAPNLLSPDFEKPITETGLNNVQIDVNVSVTDSPVLVDAFRIAYQQTRKKLSDLEYQSEVTLKTGYAQSLYT